MCSGGIFWQSRLNFAHVVKKCVKSWELLRKFSIFAKEKNQRIYYAQEIDRYGIENPR